MDVPQQAPPFPLPSPSHTHVPPFQLTERLVRVRHRADDQGEAERGGKKARRQHLVRKPTTVNQQDLIYRSEGIGKRGVAIFGMASLTGVPTNLPNPLAPQAPLRWAVDSRWVWGSATPSMTSSHSVKRGTVLPEIPFLSESKVIFRNDNNTSVCASFGSRCPSAAEVS